MTQCSSCGGDCKKSGCERENIVDEMTIEEQLAEAYEQGKKDAATAQLSTVEIEKGWRDTFSTENPFCPCNLKSFTKAVRWREQVVMSLPKEPTCTKSLT